MRMTVTTCGEAKDGERDVERDSEDVVVAGAQQRHHGWSTTAALVGHAGAAPEALAR